MPGSIWSTVGMLAVAVAILFLAYLATRWLGLRQSSGGSGRSRVNGSFRVLWQMNLGRSERIVLVQLGEEEKNDSKYLLLGVTAYSITTLKELTGAETAGWFSEEDRVSVPGFAEILKENLWKRK